MFKKGKVLAFQLIEALIVLGIVSTILSINLMSIDKVMKLQLKDSDIIYQLLAKEQKRAFYTKRPAQIILKQNEIQVQRENETYRIMQQGECYSNFKNNVMVITSRGTWERGGSIFCENQTITIGIGNSVPKRK